ncbi:MAG: sugar ABC transporter permease [Alphaproteobacteria bacterium HGW-Alphaproteobacteria-6]|nr:MAG: sugar ABC transporter permease [Alphaproteobacteria bacterium HGW-Alphaproteobacteria-6]
MAFWNRRPAAARGIERASRLRTVLAWGVALFVSFPFLYLATSGLKTEVEAPKMPPAFVPVPEFLNGIPFTYTPTLQNYRLILAGDFMPYFVNSAMATLVSTLIVLLLAIPAAYALTLPQTTSKRNVLFFLISTRFLPVVGVIIPIFLATRFVGLLDNVLALIILYTAMNLPIAVWMMRSFFQDLPADVLDAGRMDGAGTFHELTLIALPMVKNGVLATAFLAIIFAWNEFLLALTLTTTRAATVPLYMISFMSAQGLWYAKMSAAGTLVALPVVILGWFGQKWLVRGLSMGAVK